MTATQDVLLDAQGLAAWYGAAQILFDVSLHVRRGDYASNPKTTSTHGLCSLDYYRAAVTHVASKVENPEFFIFSDDIDWVRANLQLDFPHHFVAHNQGATSYNDMRLMSLCSHHVIANSSFSWWAAWLSGIDKGNGGAVIAPRQWFAGAAGRVGAANRFPSHWELL